MRTSTVAALLRLSSVPADQGGDWLEDVLRIDSEALQVARVSYWSLHADPPRIFCELCYVAPSGLFERGAVLHARTSPVYFAELDKLQIIDAADARADPRTRDLGPYLVAKNVGAVLDAPVFVQNRPVGILCHEHVGGSRAWSNGDQEFALAISQTVVARLEAHARNQSEEAERRASFLSEVAPTLAEPVAVEEVAEIAVRRALPIAGRDGDPGRVRGGRDSVPFCGARHRRGRSPRRRLEAPRPAQHRQPAPDLAGDPRVTVADRSRGHPRGPGRLSGARPPRSRAC